MIRISSSLAVRGSFRGEFARSPGSISAPTFHIDGAPAPPAGVHLYEVAQACLRAGLDAIRPGIEARAVEASALAVLRDAGLGDGFQMRFGYGVGAGYPPTWLDPFQITRTSVQKLEPGTAFVLHGIPPGWCSIPRATYEYMSRTAG